MQECALGMSKLPSVGYEWFIIDTRNVRVVILFIMQGM
jgi:hypothetical protein